MEHVDDTPFGEGGRAWGRRQSEVVHVFGIWWIDHSIAAAAQRKPIETTARRLTFSVRVNLTEVTTTSSCGAGLSGDVTPTKTSVSITYHWQVVWLRGSRRTFSFVFVIDFSLSTLVLQSSCDCSLIPGFRSSQSGRPENNKRISWTTRQSEGARRRSSLETWRLPRYVIRLLCLCLEYMFISVCK